MSRFVLDVFCETCKTDQDHAAATERARAIVAKYGESIDFNDIPALASELRQAGYRIGDVHSVN